MLIFATKADTKPAGKDQFLLSQLKAYWKPVYEDDIMLIRLGNLNEKEAWQISLYVDTKLH